MILRCTAACHVLKNTRKKSLGNFLWSSWSLLYSSASLLFHPTSWLASSSSTAPQDGSYYINNQVVNQETAGPWRDITCVVLVHRNKLKKRKEWIFIKTISVTFPKTILSQTTWLIHLNTILWDICVDGWQVIFLLVAIWWPSNKSDPRKLT